MHRQELTAARVPILCWQAQPDNVFHVRPVDTIASRLAYVIREPDLADEDGAVSFDNGAAVIRSTFTNLGVPLRNSLNRLTLECGADPILIALRETDSFGELLVRLDPATGRAEAWSITIDRTMKGGVSPASPQPEDQFISRIGHWTVAPLSAGSHELELDAVEAEVSLRIDGAQVLSLQDPDIAAGCFGIGSTGEVRLLSFEQWEYISEHESRKRQRFVREMTEFCADLDAAMIDDTAAANRVSVEEGGLTWTYPETGAGLRLSARPGMAYGEMYAGLYGNPRMLVGPFGLPEVTDKAGEVYAPPADALPRFESDNLHFRMTVPLSAPSGAAGEMSILAQFTENALWFCTAEITGIDVADAALVFGLDREFDLLWDVAGVAGEPAVLGYGPASLVTDGATADPSRTGFGLSGSGERPSSLICTDGVAGHVWKALSAEDTSFELRQVAGQPAVVLRSQRERFRWALMVMPYHPLNRDAYRKRMLHFIRYPETPYSEYRTRPSVCEYPTDEELERFAANGVRAMVWHHTWAGNNSRRREGFVVNEPEMKRALSKAHDLGIEVITYIGIVPGRHPAMGYEDLGRRMFYDKNWDLQDFVLYSVAGSFAEFLPYMTDFWCREYGLDGFYTDGGFALLDWGYTGRDERNTGMSLEELNNRFYSRIKRVLRRRRAGFGLENWGGAPIHLAGPWYDCRMIGESFEERDPLQYRDGYNPLLTSTPFKMYGMNLNARNRYNIAMAAVCLTDIQLCSGNYAWGCWPDAPSDWANLRPWWAVLESIDWDNLLDARPWWAQKLVEADCYAGYYMAPQRTVLFLANTTERRAVVDVRLKLEQLPEGQRRGRMRAIYPEEGEWMPVTDAPMNIELPYLHGGPLGFEIVT